MFLPWPNESPMEIKSLVYPKLVAWFAWCVGRDAEGLEIHFHYEGDVAEPGDRGNAGRATFDLQSPQGNIYPALYIPRSVLEGERKVIACLW